jgi:hypothetical protein
MHDLSVWRWRDVIWSAHGSYFEHLSSLVIILEALVKIEIPLDLIEYVFELSFSLLKSPSNLESPVHSLYVIRFLCLPRFI